MYKPLLVRPLGPTTPGDLWTDTITMVWDVPPWSAFTKVGKSCLLTRFVQVLLNRGDWRKGRVDSDVPVTDFIKVDLKKERSRDSKMNHVFFCSKVFFQMLHYTLNSVCGLALRILPWNRNNGCYGSLYPGLWMYIIYKSCKMSMYHHHHHHHPWEYIY